MQRHKTSKSRCLGGLFKVLHVFILRVRVVRPLAQGLAEGKIVARADAAGAKKTKYVLGGCAFESESEGRAMLASDVTVGFTLDSLRVGTKRANLFVKERK